MVASVGRITAGRGYDYLTRDVATSKHDYYTGKGEAPGVWTGRGAALLGLAGEVDAEDMAVLYGRFVVPSTAGGTRLPSGRWEPEQVLGRKVVAKTRADGSVAEPIAAFDVTFSPSKSVSRAVGADRRRAGAADRRCRPTRPRSPPGSPTSMRPPGTPAPVTAACARSPATGS